MSVPPSTRAASIDALLAERAWVARLARRLVADTASADDLVQRAWLRFLQRPPTPGGSLRSWIRVVLRNELLQAHRSDARRARREASAVPREGPQRPDDIVERAEMQLRVARAVLDLDEPLRTTILLAFYDDLGPSEIARRQGVPVETVRTRTRRALARLRARFDSDHGGDGAAWGLALLPVAGWTRADAAATLLVPSATTATAVVQGGAIVAGTKKVAAAAALLALALGVVGTLSIEALRGTDGADGASPDVATNSVSGLRSGGDASDVAPEARRARARSRMAAFASDESPSSRATAGSREEPAPPDAAGEIVGAVRLPDGSPVAGVVVRALLPWPEARTTWDLGAGPPAADAAEDRVRRATEMARFTEDNSRWGTSDERGAYRLTGVGDARYALQAWKEGFLVAPSDPASRQARPGDRADFVATPLAAIEASVVDADGRALQRAKLAFRQPSGATSFEADWTPERPTIWYAGGEFDVVACAGESRELASEAVRVEGAPGRREGPFTFTVRARSGLRGRVVLPEGCTLEHGTLRVTRIPEGGTAADAELVRADRSSHVGRHAGTAFEFLDLEPGTYHIGLVIDWDERATWSDTVEVGEGIATSDLRVPEFTADRWIAVRVETPDGALASTATVSVSAKVGSTTRWIGVDRLRSVDGTVFVPRRIGRFDLDEVDECRVVASAKEYGSRSVLVAPRTRDVVVVRFVRPGRLEVVAPPGTAADLAAAIHLSIRPKDPTATPSPGVENERPDTHRWRTALLAPGANVVGIAVAGGIASQPVREFDVTIGEGTVEAPLALPPLRRVVLRLPGRARGTRVQLRPTAASRVGWPLAETDRDGVAVFPWVPDGAYRAQVTGERNPAPPAVDVDGADLDLTLAPFAR